MAIHTIMKRQSSIVAIRKKTISWKCIDFHFYVLAPSAVEKKRRLSKH